MPCQSCPDNCSRFHFELVTLCCCGHLVRGNKTDVQFPKGKLQAMRRSSSCARFMSCAWTASRRRVPLGLCAARRSWTLWFARLLSPKGNCDYKGNNPNVGLLHIPKPNCCNHQVITFDASSSLVHPIGLCLSATAFAFSNSIA